MIVEAEGSEAGLDGLAFLFVAGLAEEGEHIALVGLHAGLVEGVDVEDVAAYAASLLEEVDELTRTQ